MFSLSTLQYHTHTFSFTCLTTTSSCRWTVLINCVFKQARLLICVNVSPSHVWITHVASPASAIYNCLYKLWDPFQTALTALFGGFQYTKMVGVNVWSVAQNRGLFTFVSAATWNVPAERHLNPNCWRFVVIQALQFQKQLVSEG